MGLEHYNSTRLKELIRDVPDFPKPGILFKDITPILQTPDAFRAMIELLTDQLRSSSIDRLVAIESRGFLLGAPVAYALNRALAIVRKPKKLPFHTKRVEYALEYGKDALEIHADAIQAGEKVCIIDDVLATGGTASATVELVESLGAKVDSLLFLMELPFLKGREKLKRFQINSLMSF